jgi:hypothetical protein
LDQKPFPFFGNSIPNLRHLFLMELSHTPNFLPTTVIGYLLTNLSSSDLELMKFLAISSHATAT